MWSDAMGQGEKAYPFVCPECGEEVRGNERHFSIQPLLNRIMLTIEGNRTSIGEELERFITVYASFGAEFLSSPLQTVQCETAKPETAYILEDQHGKPAESDGSADAAGKGNPAKNCTLPAGRRRKSGG